MNGATPVASSLDARPVVLELRDVVGGSALGSVGGDQPFNLKLCAGQVGVVFGGQETSSLLRVILGLGTLASGEVRLCGRLLLGNDAPANGAQALRNEVGFGFRELGLISNLSILANVDLPAKYHGFYTDLVPEGFFAERALLELGVEQAQWGLRPSALSGEMRKRVLLARAIVLSPRVLILDDPSAQMSTMALPELLRMIARQRDQGTAVLIGTNDLPFGIALADWVLHPSRHEMVVTYDDFVDPTWTRSAALLSARMRQL